MKARSIKKLAFFWLLTAFVLFPLSGYAKDPYKAKDFIQQLVRDTGIDAHQVQSYKRSDFAVVSKDAYEANTPKLIAPFVDCMAVNFTDSYGLFVYDKRQSKWTPFVVLSKDTARAAHVAEVVSLGATLREVVVELKTGEYLVVSYKGGLMGDHKHPLEVGKRLAELGIDSLSNVRYVDPRISTTTTIYY